MKKSNKKGFTLVELVVVIAIIGVLAAILVPSLLGYIKKAKLKKVNSNAKNAATAISGAIADLEEQGYTLTNQSGTATIKSGVTSEELQNKISNIIYTAIKGEEGVAYWEIAADTAGSAKGYTVWTQYVQGSNQSPARGETMVGQYPNAPKTPDDAEGITFKTLKKD